jgi:4'-phosphopantetheinyl transferase
MRRLLLARETGIAPEALLFREGPYGKPELTSDPDVRFNASHSGDIVALAIAHGRDVGVDVELVRAERDLRAMAAYSFSERERSDLAALAPQQFVAGFYSCWTQKEAFLKLIGAGLSQPLDAFDVEVDPAKQPALLASRMTGTKAPPCRMVRIPAGGGYAATLAMADTPVVHRVTCAWYLGDGALLTPSSVPVRDGIA